MNKCTDCLKAAQVCGNYGDPPCNDPDRLCQGDYCHHCWDVYGTFKGKEW